jgi:hypothetical protein
VHFHRGCRGRMQSRHCHPAQTSRHALDRPRLQCHHRSPLLKTQWTLSGFLGTPSRTWGQSRMTYHFAVVHPVVNCSYGKRTGFTFTRKRRRHEVVLQLMRLVGDGVRRKI